MQREVGRAKDLLAPRYTQTAKASTAKPACTWQCDTSTMHLTQMRFEGADLICVRTEILT